MFPTPKKFVAFLDGRGPSIISVGRAPIDVSAYIGARTSDVLIGLDYARKLVHQHKLRASDFDAIQSAMDDGWAGVDRRGLTPELMFIYCDRFVAGRNYKLVIKRNEKADELWLKTFHRITKGQYTKLLRGIDVMREHLEMNPGNE